MGLDRITLSRFRNHRETRLDGTARFNLLVGENGAGKTNVLEALSLLAPGRGLRRAALPDMPAQHGDGGERTTAEVRHGALWESLNERLKRDSPAAGGKSTGATISQHAATQAQQCGLQGAVRLAGQAGD